MSAAAPARPWDWNVVTVGSEQARGRADINVPRGKHAGDAVNQALEEFKKRFEKQQARRRRRALRNRLEQQALEQPITQALLDKIKVFYEALLKCMQPDGEDGPLKSVIWSYDDFVAETKKYDEMAISWATDSRTEPTAESATKWLESEVFMDCDL